MVTWNNIKIADKGFLINLSERTDRLEQSNNEFFINNINGIERFDAIKILEDSENGWKIRGCTHSHLKLLNLQVKNKWEKMILFEDDFYFNICDNGSNFEINKFLKNIENLDFDLLFLGATLLSESDYINDFILKPKKFVQTTVYISSLRLAEFVTKNFNYLNKNSLVYGEQIDSYYSILSEKKHWKNNEYLMQKEGITNHNLKIYFSYPIIFNQRESYSNIQNKHTNYIYWNNLNNKKYYPIKKYEKI